jgi:hypothetical protein
LEYKSYIPRKSVLRLGLVCSYEVLAYLYEVLAYLYEVLALEMSASVNLAWASV